ncbi:alpha/beta fold hydrolase [Agrobacterium sp. ES01]|uniref:alpha/beta fold hydrolase n=1 Tax=Agrobacterium sp. ES01 TaxID=3420714 RepID=UPI003D0E2AA0
MSSAPKFLDAPSGARLAFHQVEAVSAPYAVLVVSHGLAEHSRRYLPFAEFMAARGCHVFVHDHRGHGETTANDADPGIFAKSHGAAKVIDDIVAMRDHAVETYPGLPVILFGHSMGGLIALNAAIARPDAFQALAIWNSNFNTGLSGYVAKVVLKIERMLKGSDVPSLIMAKATFDAWGKSIQGRKTLSDWLSHDDEVVRAFIADPLCGFEPSVSMWADVIEFSKAPLRPGALSRLSADLPIHLVGGGQDPATRCGQDVAWMARRLTEKDFSNVTLRIYDDMRHETLNELGRDIAMADFAEWCASANITGDAIKTQSE